MNELEDLERDPHLQATGFFRELEDAALGTVKFPGSPVRIDRQPLPARMPPRLGEHTAEVLGARSKR